MTPDRTSPSFGTLVVDNPLFFYSDDPNTIQSFSSSPVAGRYVTFRAVDYLHNTGNHSADLSEIATNGVPEPMPAALAGAGLAALPALRRRRLS